MKYSPLRSLFLAILLAAPPLVHAQLPPLIAREVFFADPEISGAQLSPDGMKIAFRKPYDEVMNVYVKSIDEPFEAAKPITADDRPVPGFFWSEDSRYILYVQDKGGNENYNVYAVDPAGLPEAETGVPPARNLTPLDDVRASIVHTDEDRPSELIVGLNDRDPQLHDLYRVNIQTGERELLFKNEQNILGWDFDLDGKLRLATRMDPETGDVEIHRINEDQ
jgi:dipeptidyl aminopeptidase/acylaminoacyl peptidase